MKAASWPGNHQPRRRQLCRLNTDKRSGITNDPNRPDDPEYIVRLLAQVITVSVETVKVVKGLPALGR